MAVSRDEWYAHYRLLRMCRGKKLFCLGKMSEALKEIYEFSLNDKDSALLYMIEKYENKISQRLKAKRDHLKEKGREQGRLVFKDLFYKDNPLLKIIQKDSYCGSSYPVPVIL